MDEPFEIIVSYRGEELSFTAVLLKYGYTHKIQVLVNDQQVLFEPDEERNYRAVLNLADGKEPGKTDTALLQAIAETIESILK